jgi:hypothetical protein
MSAMFDFRSLSNFIAYPARLVFGAGRDAFEQPDRSARTPLILRWRRGDDGKLDSRWERDE